MWWFLPIGFVSGATVQSAINWINDNQIGSVKEIKCECRCITKNRSNDPSISRPVITSTHSFGEDGVSNLTQEQKREYAKSIYDQFSDSCVSGECRVFEKFSLSGKWHNPELFDF